jgi:hypothetical protein
MARKKSKQSRGKSRVSLKSRISNELQFVGLPLVVKTKPFGGGWLLMANSVEYCKLTRKGVKWTVHWNPRWGGQVTCDNLQLAIQSVRNNVKYVNSI